MTTGFDINETNAASIAVGSPITQAQIDAIAALEYDWVECRESNQHQLVEDVLHAFTCQAIGSCVCGTTKPLDVQP